jgi:hypothetical protein
VWLCVLCVVFGGDIRYTGREKVCCLLIAAGIWLSSCAGRHTALLVLLLVLLVLLVLVLVLLVLLVLVGRVGRQFHIPAADTWRRPDLFKR